MSYASSSFWTILTAALSLTLASCSQGGEPGQRRAQSTGKKAQANALAPAAADATGEKGKGKGGEVDDGADGKGDGDDLQTTDDTPKGGKDDGKGGKDDGKGGKGDDDEDLPLPGKGDDETPTQKPGKDDGKGDEPIPVETKPCVYLDADKPDFVLTKGKFGPNLPPIDVPSSLITGAVQSDGETYIGEFTLYQENGLSTNFMTRWDGQTGRIPYDYTFVVKNSSTDKCEAFLKFVKQEPRTNNGCFDLNTRIRMADGTEQPIAAVSAGDLLWNPVTKLPVRVAEVVKGPEAKKGMIEIAFAGRHVLVTEKHPMLVKGGLKQAKDVTEADYMYDERGIIHRVTLAKRLPANAQQIVVNVRLDTPATAATEHMVLADGIVAGDLYLQRKLSGQSSLTAKKK